MVGGNEYLLAGGRKSSEFLIYFFLLIEAIGNNFHKRCWLVAKLVHRKSDDHQGMVKDFVPKCLILHYELLNFHEFLLNFNKLYIFTHFLGKLYSY